MNRHRIPRLVLVLLLTLLATGLPSSVRAAPGDLDTSFGKGGRVTTDFAGAGAAVAVQPDGKLVAVGYAAGSGTDEDFALARYNADGSPDLSFGTAGKVTTDFYGFNDGAFAVVIQGDGKLVVAGYASTANAAASFDFAVARYNSDGTLDRTFGKDGKITADFSGRRDEARSVVIQDGGKLLLAGFAFTSSTDPTAVSFALARYTPDGSLDTTFGCDSASCSGTVTTDFFGTSAFGMSVAGQADGKLVVAGYAFNHDTGHDVALARYTPNGSLDLGFGTAGKVTTNFAGGDDFGNAVAIQPDGKLVVAGFAANPSTGYDFALARYRPDGNPDLDFGTAGKVTTDFSGGDDFAYAVVIQTGGKLVVAGAAYNSNTGYDVAMTRYLADGSLDSTFGANGRVTTDFAGGFDAGMEIALQADGKLVVAGNSDGNFALARYLAENPLYTFTGFLPPLAPVGDGSIVNTGKAGRTYPVKWQLTDSNGAYVTDLRVVTAIQARSVACATLKLSTSHPIDDALTVGIPGLHYDHAANQFVYNWRTPSTPGCYLLTVHLDDGAVYTAAFQLS